MLPTQFIEYYKKHIRPNKMWQWHGYKLEKYADDAMLYAEAIFNKKPDFLIETGTHWGGSTLFFAHMMDLVGSGQVISIDIGNDEQKDKLPKHPRITYLSGSSVDLSIIEQIKSRIKNSTAMVSLDSDHSREHVARELVLYSPLVTSGQYMVVEDTSTIRLRGARRALFDFIKNDCSGFKHIKINKKITISNCVDGWLLKR